MIEIACLGTLALLVTLATIRPVRWLMFRDGVLDVPNFRSAHTVPTPRGGGLACALGVISASLIANLIGANVPWTVVLGAVALASLGYIDDRRHLAALPRLMAQAVVGVGVGWSVGGPSWSLLGLIAMPLIVNIVNFMDGVNGITALTITVWGAAAAYAGFRSDARPAALLAVLTAAAALGFLPWNARKGYIFLGDVGSYLFGALVAGGILLGARDGASPALLTAPMFVYALDVGVTLTRRFSRHETILEAHREHIYQRLVHKLDVPHLVAAFWAAGLAAGVTLAWIPDSAMASLAVSSVLLGLYLASVPVAALLWPRFSNRRAAQLAKGGRSRL